MRLNRFFIKNSIPDEGIFILENGEIVHQLLRVLKIKKGEKIIFFNGSGFDFEMRVDKLVGRFVSGKIIEKIKNERDPLLEVHLYQSLIKKDKLEWILEKCTELGVKFFHPVISRHSVKTGLNIERDLRIVKEATEQSGQDKIPEILEVTKFKDAVEDIGNSGLKILLDPSGNFKAKPSEIEGLALINIFIGPEGGFDENELNWAKEHDFVIVSLGPRILRSETAGVIASGFVLIDNII